MKTPRDVEGDLATEELVDPAEAAASAGAIIAPKDVVGRSPWEIFWRQFRKEQGWREHGHLALSVIFPALPLPERGYEVLCLSA